jgi:hypothetical protein
MSAVTPELEQAVRRCAVLRARWMPWVEIAAELHVPPDVLERWPWQYREIWRPAHAQEFERLQAELEKEIDKELEQLRKESPEFDAWARRREMPRKRRDRGRKP